MHFHTREGGGGVIINFTEEGEKETLQVRNYFQKKTGEREVEKRRSEEG
jgi:hypothetical protein